MRNIINNILRCFMGLTMVLFLSTTVNAQGQVEDEHTPRFKPTKFTNFDHVISESLLHGSLYRDEILRKADSAMVEALVLQSKFEKRLIVGGVVTAVGIAGIVYTLNMPTPVFFSQDGVPLNYDEALQKRRDRRIAGGISTIVTGVGAFLIVDSFKFNQRMEANLGLNELSLRFFITGKRDYLKGKKNFQGKEYFREYHR